MTVFRDRMRALPEQKMRRVALAAVLSVSLAPPLYAQTEDAEPDSPVGELPEIGPAVFMSIDGERAYRIEDWIGAPVELSGSGEEIGEIETLMLGEDGRTIAAILGVGGFLGIGEKLVAVDISSLQAVREDGEFHLRLDATRGQIEKADPVMLDE